ncbi:cell wall hydrolase [Novosphingobium aquiterrae]|uniref:Cell wall hydrolase n=1 Tax=Novosphingobium aquiterrae TaxID=624388 RepID=A0ABV6PGI1_9SPHN
MKQRSVAVLGLGLAMIAALVAMAMLIRPDRGSGVAQPPSAAPVPIATGELIAVTADNRSIISEADAARRANAALAVVPRALEAAAPFAAASDPVIRDKAAQCLAEAMYYEAAFEGEQGRRAVAQVVLNRVRHPAFPHSVCDVVYQRTDVTCQFTFACDGARSRPPLPKLWERTLREARDALAGRVDKAVGMATHYHADYVYPVWAPRLEKVAVVGQHLFYRWPQGWGRREVFTARYSGTEPGELVAPPPLSTDPASDAAPDSALPDGEVAPRRTVNDAGYLDPGKGWKPSISVMESEAAGQASSPPPHP